MERMSNFINARVEELREHLKINHEEIGYLETRLDRAKKDNEKLEKENKRLKEENKKLKSDLGECECSMHFENDEVGYRKRECKKLKEELSKYKKQYQHSMGFMEEDTIQELKDIGEI